MTESITPWFPLIGVIAAVWTATAQFGKQLRVQQRMKLVERAHLAIDDVTTQAYSALEAHQDWRRARGDDGRGETESRTAYRARWSLRRQSANLPPALYQAFDELSAAYERFDTEAAIVHASADKHPDHVLTHIESFQRALKDWDAARRSWVATAWLSTKV